MSSIGRVGDSYDDRRFIDERFPREDVYARGAFHRDILERENYPPPPVGLWNQSRRRSYDDEYPLERDSRRQEKPYIEPYHEIDCRSVDHYRDHGPARYGGRDHDDHVYDEYDLRNRISHQGREDSRERDCDYSSRHSYDSDYERRRDGNWRRRDSRDRDRDKRDLSRERDQSPYRSHDRSRSRSHGQDDRIRSRSPRSRSRGRSHREDSYDDGRYDRSERRRDREDKHHHDHYSVVLFIWNFLSVNIL